MDAINAVEPTWRLVGLADDNPSPEDIERLARTEHSVLRRPDYELLPEGTAYVIGVGGGATRRLIADRLESLGWSAAVLVHPRLPPAPMSNLVLALSCVLSTCHDERASGGTST